MFFDIQWAWLVSAADRIDSGDALCDATVTGEPKQTTAKWTSLIFSRPYGTFLKSARTLMPSIPEGYKANKHKLSEDHLDPFSDQLVERHDRQQ